jgi:hypothetical protein
MRHNDKGKLRKLGSEKKTNLMNEVVLKGADVYISEQQEALDVAIDLSCYGSSPYIARGWLGP